MVKNPPANPGDIRDAGSVLGLERFPGGSDSEESASKCGRPGFDPWVGKIPQRRA